MTHITKGANAPVPTAPLRIAVGRHLAPGAPVVDASAMLLDATGQVRGDADIVFHGQPAHPSGAVRHVGTGEGAGQLAEWLELDLLRLEPSVQRVLIAGSCDDGAFGQVPGLYVQVTSVDGTIVTHYDITDASSETAFVLGEFYRRDAAWKFRAVGQGYESGLAGLATDFGVVVAEGGEATAPVAPVSLPASGPQALTGVAKTGQVPGDATAPPARGPAVAAAPPAGPGVAVGVPGPLGVPLPGGVSVPVAASPLAGAPGVVTPAASLSWGAGLFAFEPLTYSGKGAKTITVDLPFPQDSAPVILEARVDQYHFLHVAIPGRSEDVFCTDLPEFYGRALLVPPRKGGPLKLRVRQSGKWELTVLPLTAARPIGPGTIEGSGREIFIHTGAAADLKVRATDRHSGWFQLNQYRGETPDELRRPDEQLVHAWNGRRVKEKVRIPDGPVLLVIDKGRHHWEFTLDPLPLR
ncbi:MULTISPECIES: TerD family protein [Streptomyces]|uniref:Stress protein n=1 Tax=Streptomyces viridochromogenes TaxID=1938 RepID=A0A0L8JQ61_STRVR|nr:MULTISPECIES: TerD family protein [Streptomyces]KOG15745.1 stress protein [Streptomyces viridochromogenes]